MNKFKQLFQSNFKKWKGISEKIGSPREIIKEAFSIRLIDDGDLWIKIMLARNTLSHLYDEETSREIYDDIKEHYLLEFKKLIQKLSYKEWRSPFFLIWLSRTTKF